MTTTVVNCKCEKYDVLCDRTSIFGNPFHEWKYGREECIRLHEGYFWKRIETDVRFREQVHQLQYLRLGCHCKPLDCHVDIIAAYLNAREHVQRTRMIEAGRDPDEAPF